MPWIYALSRAPIARLRLDGEGVGVLRRLFLNAAGIRRQEIIIMKGCLMNLGVLDKLPPSRGWSRSGASSLDLCTQLVRASAFFGMMRPPLLALLVMLRSDECRKKDDKIP